MNGDSFLFATDLAKCIICQLTDQFYLAYYIVPHSNTSTASLVFLLFLEAWHMIISITNLYTCNCFSWENKDILVYFIIASYVPPA